MTWFEPFIAPGVYGRAKEEQKGEPMVWDL